MSTRFSSPNTPIQGRAAVPDAGAFSAEVPGTPGNATPFHRELGTGLMAVHELGYLMLGEMAVEHVCSRMARLAHDTIAGVDEVSVTVLRGPCADTKAATRLLAARLEEHRYATDSGPCLHAARHRETVLVADMRTESRWAAYTARAVHAGVLSSLSVPLTLPQGSCGALNLTPATPPPSMAPATRSPSPSPSPSPSTPRSPSPPPRCTPPPPCWPNNANRRWSPVPVIEQATGNIVGERRCSPDAAFVILATPSHDTHRTPREVAAATVAQPHPDATTTRRPRR